MKIIATLTINGTKETRLEGDATIFDNRLRPWLSDVGFWLAKWRYAGHSGPNQKSRVFIPWTSLLMIETLEEVNSG